MKKGTCCALQRKFFRNKIPSLPGNNYGFLELEPQFKKKKKKNSRITEAEERIRDLEDERVEVTTAEQTKEKRMKRIGTVSENSGTTLNVPTFEL